MKTNNVLVFSGTHGTGKTTQAYSLSSALRAKGNTVAVIDEVARECPFPINKDASVDSQYWILSTQIKRETTLGDKYSYLISDRSIVDTIAYGVELGLLSPSIMCGLREYILYRYLKIYLLDPRSFNFQIEDGIRDLDKKFRENIHNRIKSLYDDNCIPYILVTSQDQIYED